MDTSRFAPSRRSWMRKPANLLALATFLGGAIPVTWVAWGMWKHASTEESVPLDGSIAPYLIGFTAAFCVSMLWVLLAGMLAALSGFPRGRWVAFGWGLFMLASVGPLAWHYRAFSAIDSIHTHRFLNVGMGLAATVTAVSIMPRAFRMGIGLSLVLCFVMLPGLGAIVAALVRVCSTPLAFVGISVPSPVEVITSALEYALVGGIGMGMLLGVGACIGWVKFDADAALACRNASVGSGENEASAGGSS